jgi:N-methylhydantoinase A/oxoprolinase/acetone carboxylase beta subunit
VAENSKPPALEHAPVAERRCCVHGSWVDVPVYHRELLHPGHSFLGPALIDSRTSTIFVPDAFDASVDAERSVVLHLRGATGVPTSGRAADEVGA